MGKTLKIPLFHSSQLTSIAQVLGETSTGLTGTEITRLLAESQIDDVSPELGKWRRIYNAFAVFQNKYQSGSHIVIFIKRAMHPASYTGNPQLFQLRQDALNPILSLSAMRIDTDCEMKRVAKATHLDEAVQRANRFKAALTRRDVHADIFHFCTAEILAQNYFHAVFEAMKSVTAKIRTMTGLTSDGADLVRDAFQLGKTESPLFAINSLHTETEKGEQRGFVNLLTGLYGTIRNPLAHNPKIEWDMSEADALDILSTLSLVHRKLDKARKFTP